ncbi:hypothetical protein Q1695_005834 [Nippostrongylus brasiliensis]|nr:hypothetical protein Q1695_005834 [Nippostrongylus brasiliensis]
MERGREASRQPQTCHRSEHSTKKPRGAPFQDDEEDELLMGPAPIDMMTTGGDQERYQGPVDPRVMFAQMVLEQGALYVMRKFKRVQRYKGGDSTFNAFMENPSRNRYADIKCLDSTRVILKDRSNDYIHANWVKGFDGKRFICAQAPLESTIGDFWHMIVQENCRTIIMLCSLIEDEKEKCAQYYPTSVGASFSVEDTQITLVEQKQEEDLTISRWDVKQKDKSLTVRHLQCPTWPDHMAPKRAVVALSLHQEILANKDNPILVHCSAGIGRTCTIVGIEVMLERITSRRFQSGTAIVRTLRKSRYGAIQKPVQFLFMHYAILEILCKDGVLSSSNPLMVSFREAYEGLVEKALDIRKKLKEKREETTNDTKDKVNPTEA